MLHIYKGSSPCAFRHNFCVFLAKESQFGEKIPLGDATHQISRLWALQFHFMNVFNGLVVSDEIFFFTM